MTKPKEANELLEIWKSKALFLFDCERGHERLQRIHIYNRNYTGRSNSVLLFWHLKDNINACEYQLNLFEASVDYLDKENEALKSQILLFSKHIEKLEPMKKSK